MSDLISRQDAIDYLMTNMVWCDEDGYEKSDNEKRDDITDLINGVPSTDAIPIGCLELEKRDCGFSDQCDMGSSYTRERERACKNIIEWWKTPSYQRCLSVATERGFVSKKWREVRNDN